MSGFYAEEPEIMIHYLLSVVRIGGLIAFATVVVVCASHADSLTDAKVSIEDADYVQLHIRDGMVYAGELPHLLAQYDSDGKPIGLSADLRNSGFDLSKLPTSSVVGLATELNKDYSRRVKISVPRKRCQKVFINDDLLVFADSIDRVQNGGPFINIKFLSDEKRLIPIDKLTVTITDRSRKYNPIIQIRNHTLLLGVVGTQPLKIIVRDAESGKTWTDTIFPYLRSATPGIVLYQVRNVTFE